MERFQFKGGWLAPERTRDKSKRGNINDGMRSYNDRLGALASIAVRIGIYRDTRRLAQEAMQAIADLLPIKTALLLLVDKNTSLPVFHEAFNIPPEEIQRYHHLRSWDECMEGEVFRGKEAILIQDVSTDARAVHYPEGTMSLGLIPLLTRERVIGVLSVTTAAPYKLDQSSMEFLLTLGSQLGIYLDNARLLEELEERNKQLLVQNKDLEELLSIISHDLRSPLATIAGYASLLIKKGEDLDLREQSQFAETILRKTKETSRRFDDLLSVFRAGIGKNGEAPEEVDVRAVVEEALKEADPDNYRERFTIEIPDQLPRLRGFPNHLMHLLTNLFSNAFKFTDPEGDPRIRVGYERETTASGTNHRFSISDNGIGIPEDYIPDIFRPFTRVPAVEDIPGSGIGLASVQRIVRSHGGSVDISSKEGEGTTVTFTLPWEEIKESPESRVQSPE